jgi:putative toxin-antitoxin system antitoxin component (TIGR02293 family)
MTRFLEEKTAKENYSALVGFYNLSWKEKEHILHQGVCKVQLSTFRELVQLNWEELAILLAVTDRTLHLWRNNHKLAYCYADRFIQYVEVFSLLYNAITIHEQATVWLRTPCRELSGRKPLEVLETYPGVIAVEYALKRKLAERWHADLHCKKNYQFTLKNTNTV